MAERDLRTKREIATDVLNQLFTTSNRISIEDAVEMAKPFGVSRRTLQRAAKDLCVTEVHNGPHPAFWERRTR